MNTQNSTQHALLPIHIVKKSIHGDILGKKEIHFQINSQNTYNINYKFFMPKGFHLANNVAPDVNCRLINGRLNIPSVTFTYVQNGNRNLHHAQPVTVSYVSTNNNQTLRQQKITGRYGQNVDVLRKAPLPSGYQLVDNQRTHFVIRDHAQSVSLVVKPRQAAVSSHDNQPDSNLQQLQADFNAHQNRVQHGLIHRIRQYGLSSLQRVTAKLLQSLGYPDVAGLKADTVHHKVIGRAQNSSGRSIYLRSRAYDGRRPVSVSEVRDFITCVMDNHADKGVFITTSSFSTSAQQEAQRHHLRTIDSGQLARLMIQNGIGTRVEHLYRVVDIDPHFFH